MSVKPSGKKRPKDKETAAHALKPLPMVELKDFESCAARLKALADPERLRIVQILFHGPKHVGEIAQELQDEIVNVSHHLGVLRHASVVQTEKRGKFVVYSLDPAIAAAGLQGEAKTLNLGCCRLNLNKSPEA